MGLTRPRAHQLQDSDFKSSCRVITTTNITLSGGAPATVDGVSLSAQDRVLVTGQSAGSENGIYRVTTVGTGSNGTWVRAQDADANGDITAGLTVMVTEGTSYADTSWKLTTNDPITVGTTALTFEQASAYGFGTVTVDGTSLVADQVGDTLTITAGNNISLSGNATSDTYSISVSDSPTFTGNVTGGNLTTTGTITTGGLVTGNLTPTANVTYYLGNATNQWHSVFVGPGSLYINGQRVLTDDSGTIVVGADINQNISLTTTGTGDIEFNPGGTIELKGNVVLAAGKTLSQAGGSATEFSAGVKSDTITSRTADTNLTLSGAGTGVVNVNDSLTVSQNLTVTGNLTVNGATTTVSSTNTTIEDALIVLADGQSGSPTKDAGFVVERGSSTNVAWLWDESADEFVAITTSEDGTTAGDVGVTAYANIHALNFIGNGSQLTGLPASYTNSDVADYLPTYTGNLVSLTGAVTTTANITGGNLLTGGLLDATGNVSGANFNTGGLVSATGNITGGNLITGGLASVTGNITGGNLITAGAIEATGNVTGAYILGDGSQLTNLPDAGNAFTTITVSGQSNIVADSSSDTLTLVAGTGITITANATSDTLTFSSVSSDGAFASDSDFGLTTDEVTVSEDLGDLASTNSTTYDLGTIISAEGLIYPGQLVLPQYATASLPDATVEGQLAYDTDTNSVKFTDGTQWTGYAGTSSPTFTGTAAFASVTASGTAVVTGNITGGNLITGGLVSVTGNVTGGNLVTSGTVSATNGWSGTGSAASAIAGIPQVITVERGGVGTTLTGLAFGNGSSGNGMRMPYAGKIILATLHCTDLNGTWSAYLEKNGTTNASYALSATASTADAGDTDYFTTPFTFAAGDAINWQQQSVPTGCTTSVISFWVVFD